MCNNIITIIFIFIALKKIVIFDGLLLGGVLQYYNIHNVCDIKKEKLILCCNALMIISSN